MSCPHTHTLTHARTHNHSSSIVVCHRNLVIINQVFRNQHKHARAIEPTLNDVRLQLCASRAKSGFHPPLPRYLARARWVHGPLSRLLLKEDG
jgi:hypothetical protein